MSEAVQNLQPNHELVFEGFHFEGFTQSQAEQTVSVFQANLKQLLNENLDLLLGRSNLSIRNVHLTLTVNDFGSPHVLGQVMARQIWSELF